MCKHGTKIHDIKSITSINFDSSPFSYPRLCRLQYYIFVPILPSCVVFTFCTNLRFTYYVSKSILCGHFILGFIDGLEVIDLDNTGSRGDFMIIPCNKDLSDRYIFFHQGTYFSLELLKSYLKVCEKLPRQRSGVGRHRIQTG